jgi:hypothetical protein
VKIKRIKLHSFRNEEWFHFFTEFKKFVEEQSPQALQIEEVFADFLILYVLADEVLEKIRKSPYTALVVKYDGRRDNTFRGMEDVVRSATRHYDPVKQEAAERVSLLFDHYSNLPTRPYNEETAAIYNFLQDLRGRYAAEAAILDLTGWANELERNNSDFEAAVLNRTHEAAENTAPSMVDIRRRADRCYLNIVERIEALSLIQGDAAFESFINLLNANIERYQRRLNRKGSTAETNEQNID